MAAISTVRSMGFTAIAQCEVIQRATAMVNNVMANPSGQAWMQEIKNYAAAGCMHGQGGAGELFQNHPGNNPCPGGTIYGVTTCIGSGVQNPLSDSINAAWGNITKNETPTAKMGNCFPYAYSTALYSYLQTMGFKQVPTQMSYTSKNIVHPNPVPGAGAPTNPGPLIQINNCQATIKDPTYRAPSPPPAPSNTPIPSPTPSSSNTSELFPISWRKNG